MVGHGQPGLFFGSPQLLGQGAFDFGLINLASSAQHLIGTKSNLTLTLEVVYGHAWSPVASRSQNKTGIATISPDQIIRPKK